MRIILILFFCFVKIQGDNSGTGEKLTWLLSKTVVSSQLCRVYLELLYNRGTIIP